MTRIHWAGIVRAIRIPGRRRIDRDIDAELRFHLDTRIAELVAAGQTRDDATRQARDEFGDVAASHRELAEVDRRLHARGRRAAFTDVVRQDLRYALRGFRREPGFAAGVVLTFALAVGATAAVFTLIDPLFFEKPPGLTDAAALRRVYTVNPSRASSGGSHIWRIFSYREFGLIREALSGHARVALFASRDSVPLGQQHDSTVAAISYVTADFLPMTARAVRGRFFTAGEDDVSSPSNVAVLSKRFNTRLFGENADPIGRTAYLGGKSYTIIGVAGGGFEGIEWSAIDAWVPFSTAPELASDQQPWYDRGGVAYPMVVRLDSNAPESEVRARASLAYARASADSGAARGRSVLLSGLAEAAAPIKDQQEITISTRLAIVAGIVLLIACANVANLMLSRMLRRQREFAVRLALGVSRRRLALQLVLESLALAALATVAALVVGAWMGSAMRALLLPRVDWIGSVIDLRIVVFAVSLAMLSALLSAVVPATLAGRLNLTAELSTARQGISASRSLVRSGLLVLQTALSTMLLVGTTLFARSLTAVKDIDTGVDIERLVVTSAYFPDQQRHPERATAFPEVAARLVSNPAVAAVSWGSTAPLYSWYSFVPLYEQGRDGELTTADARADFAAMTPGFFEVTGTRILKGRGLNETDTRAAPWVMVVGETMARNLWPNGSPIGRCISVRSREAACYTIVGVAEDMHAFQRIEPAANRFYIPFSQLPNERALPSVLLVRTGLGADPVAVARTARAELSRLLPGAAITSRDAISILAPELRPWQLGARLFGALGMLALVVAAIGVYSVVAFDTRLRTRELGIRIALGAPSRTLLRMMAGQGVRVTVAGIAVGVLGALMGGRFVSALVYGVSPADPLSMVVASATLLVVAIAACLAPAIQSTRVDPVIAMRAD